MHQQNDSSPRKLDPQMSQPDQQPGDEQLQGWLASLDSLTQAVANSDLESTKKQELVAHIGIIRSELSSGQWPTFGESVGFEQIVHEAGDLEEAAQQWQMLSIQLAQWVRAVSDSLGIR